MAASLGVAPPFAAVVLLAPMPVGHADVGGPPADLRLVDEAARVLAAASPVILRHAGREHPVPAASTVPAGATASHARGAEVAVGVLHSRHGRLARALAYRERPASTSPARACTSSARRESKAFTRSASAEARTWHGRHYRHCSRPSSKTRRPGNTTGPTRFPRA